MCSIGEDDFGDDGGVHSMITEPRPTSTFVSDEICKKCNERQVVVKLNLKDAQCEPCFLQFVRHKFRAALGSTRIVERGAKVLLVFDGTVECCVMFDMIRYAMKEEKFKRLTFESCAVIVDDTCTFESNAEKRQEYLNESLRLLEYFQFQTYYTSIANNVSVQKIENFNNFQLPIENLDAEKQFTKTLNSIRSQTSSEDFVLTARLNAVRETAAKLNCKYAFVSSITHQIATTLLVNVALGRGSSVANDISFCDNRPNCQVKILRPIRHLSALEIETYVQFNQNINWPTRNHNYFNSISTNPNASIQNLTKKFVNGLQENFSSTVSTVFRTGDKISTAASPSLSSVDEPKQTCKFCHSILDYENSNTLFAIEYSRCVSACADQTQVNDVSLMTKKAKNALLGQQEDDDVDVKNVWKHLCHGCRNIFRELDGHENYLENTNS